MFGKLLNAYSELDLAPTKLNIELVQAVYIYYNVFKFRVRFAFSFFLSYRANKHII